MKPMETSRPVMEHHAFRDDNMREQEGLLAEIAPPEQVQHPLEDRIIGKLGRSTKEDIQMLMTGGAM